MHTTWVVVSDVVKACSSILHMIYRIYTLKFSSQFYLLLEFLLETCWEVVPEEIFFHVSFCWRCPTWGLNRGLTFNKPTDYGDYKMSIPSEKGWEMSEEETIEEMYAPLQVYFSKLDKAAWNSTNREWYIIPGCEITKLQTTWIWQENGLYLNRTLPYWQFLRVIELLKIWVRWWTDRFHTEFGEVHN